MICIISSVMANLLAIRNLICGTLFISSAAAVAQSSPWVKVTDNPTGTVVNYTASLHAGPFTPNTQVTHPFPESVRVWETLNDDNTLTAPWTAVFSQIIDPASSFSYSVTGWTDSLGMVTWTAPFETTLTSKGGSPAVQKWHYTPTDKYQERKQEYDVASDNMGGGN